MIFLIIPAIIYLLIGVFFATAVSDMLRTQIDNLHTGAYLLTLAATVVLWPIGFTKRR